MRIPLSLLSFLFLASAIFTVPPVLPASGGSGEKNLLEVKLPANEHAGLVDISIDDVTADEDDGTMIFTVSLSDVPTSNVTVQYSTSEGTAKQDIDYEGKSGTLTIPAGLTSGNITIVIIDDDIEEEDEKFTVNLSDPSTNAKIDDGEGTGTILDNDAQPSISIDNVSADENEEKITFTVSLSEESGKKVEVDYETNDGSAEAGSDYISKSGTLTISAGNVSETITISLIDDDLDEPRETFTVNLSSPVNATISDGRGRGTIKDDDSPPKLSIDDNSANENDGSMTFTISLSEESGKEVEVDYSTSDGTATAGDDYTSKSGTLTIPAGSTGATATIAIIDDNIDEDDETFNVDLSNPKNATVSGGQGEGTIIDDDLPSLSIADTSTNEGSGPMAFTVSLSRESAVPVAVQYSTSDGTAVSGDDYTGTSGNLTIPAGVSSGTIMISLNDDAVFEEDETFTVSLSNPTNAMLDDDEATGTILDDDVPAISIDDVTADEDAGTLDFTVSLSNTITATVTVDFATKDSTAIAGDDYTANSGTLSFSSGTTSLGISVSVSDDALDEEDEIFTIELSNPSNGTIADGQGVGTIQDNDVSPTLSIGDVSLAEPDSSSATMTFTVSLSAVSGREIMIDYATADSSAEAPDDYLATSGTLTIPAGSPSGTIGVTVNSDTLSEIDEVYFLNLSNPVDATISDGQGRGVIGGDIILSVVLVSFEAKTGSKGVDLTWQTSSETDNAGFHIFRSQDQDSGFQQINASLIAGADTTAETQNYAYTDTNVVSGETYYYNLASVHTGGSMYLHGPISITVGPFTGIDDAGFPQPTSFALFQNHPNPFNPTTVIDYQLSQNSDVRLSIYTTNGRSVRTLVSRAMPAGRHSVVWDATDETGARVASGVYVYKLQAGNFATQKKLLLLK
jgi:hypothetical protein